MDVPSPSLPGARSHAVWLTHGSLALIDQALQSGSNFLLAVLLARWLAPALYGAYAVAFALLLLASLAHQAVLLEPMSVIGSTDYEGRLRGYVRVLLRANAAVSVALVLGMAVVASALASRNPPLAVALLGATLAGPSLMLAWLLRRALYLAQRPGAAVGMAATYSFVLLGAAWGAQATGKLSPPTAFVVIALAALAGCAVVTPQVRSFTGCSADVSIGAVLRRHWRYGRWALLSLCAMWLAQNVYYLAVGSGLGMAEAGALRALLNFTLPVTQACIALFLLLLPHAARLHATGRSDRFRSLTARIIAVFSGGALLYAGVVALFPGALVRSLYDGRYDQISSLVPWIALGSVCWAALYGWVVVLSAMQAPHLAFRAYAVAALLAIVIGLPAVAEFGLAGATGAWALSSLGGGVVGWRLTHALWRTQEARGARTV